MFPSKSQTDEIRYKYPEGTRIQLDSMFDDPYPIEPGTQGTVEFVDDAGQIHTRWDNGRGIAVIPGIDEFHKI